MGFLLVLFDYVFIGFIDGVNDVCAYFFFFLIHSVVFANDFEQK